jgi:hypothetical protein
MCRRETIDDKIGHTIGRMLKKQAEIKVHAEYKDKVTVGFRPYSPKSIPKCL